MTRTMEKALAEIETLPSDWQDRIGEQLLDRIAKWRSLKADIDSGRLEAEQGLTEPLDADEIMRKAREQYGVA